MVALKALHSTQHLTQQKITIDLLTTHYKALIFTLTLLTFLLIPFFHFSSKFQNRILVKKETSALSRVNPPNVGIILAYPTNSHKGFFCFPKHLRSTVVFVPLVGQLPRLVQLCCGSFLRSRSFSLQHLDLVLRVVDIQSM